MTTLPGKAGSTSSPGTAVKIRAEDGRKVTDTDISLFINHLPAGGTPRNSPPLDASGSTSQAANIAEALRQGAGCCSMDEDTPPPTSW